MAPSPETIADGSYAFSRPLFIYVSASSADRPEVAGFVDFYLSDAGLETVDETGYVRMAEYDTVRGVWESRTVGRSFSE